MIFKKSELPNGIRVVSEFHPHSQAVSLGIWVLTGTRDEAPEEAGVSHLLEHLVFKGTKKRSAYQIAKSLEALGGDLNAYTTREYTVYHCLVLKDHWQKGLEILSDLVTNMKLNREDFELEKSVVLQEIGMGEDQLDELIYDYYLEKTLPKNPVGKSILGNVKSISNMTQKQVVQYYKKAYVGSNIIVSATGGIDHHDLADAVKKYLGKKPKGRAVRGRQKPNHKAVNHVYEKTSEQLHLLMGFPVTSFRDIHRFEAFVVNALLGGGMTSKLYQSVREKRGLVYSIYSSLSTFEDFGWINIYASCEKKNMKAVYKTIMAELKKLKKQRISDHDLNLYKTQVIGSLLLGSDDVENRMNSLGVNEMVFGKYKPVTEVVKEIESITAASVNQFIKKYLDFDQIACFLMGGGAKDLEEWLNNGGRDAKN